MKKYKSLYHENKNDYDTSLSKVIFDKLNKPKFTLTSLYKIKTINELKKYFDSYNKVKSNIELQYLDKSPEDFKKLMNDYYNNSYDNSLYNLINGIYVLTKDVNKMDKLFKTKTTPKELIDKAINLNNLLKLKYNFEKDIGY